MEKKPVLQYHAKNPPLAVLAASALAGVELELKQEAVWPTDAAACNLRLATGDVLGGIPSALRYVARSKLTADELYGAGPIDACQVDEWLERAPLLLVQGSGFEAACGAVNAYLALRAYFAGYTLTVADLAVWGQLTAVAHWDKLQKNEEQLPHLVRWYRHVHSIPDLQAVVAQHLVKTNRPAAAGKQTKQAKEAAQAKKLVEGPDLSAYDLGLPGAVEGKVVTRFPPEPSGYLHIGHAKAAMLNQYFADLYKGKMLMRFDDTNPSKESDEFVENIMADVKSLGLRYTQLTYTSDYFLQMEDLTRRLIKAGHVYADDTPLEQMREERMACTESACRNKSPEDSLKAFEAMLAGTKEGKTFCLRIKLDMKNENGALRDPVVFRCNDHKHWRTGNKYKAYPTYDLACPFVDALEGVTHALRSSEYRDREEQYYRILKLEQEVWPGLPSVHIWDFSRLTFINTLMSKRKLKWFVETSRVDGWTDPRFPTVQGLLRRGLQVPALQEFILAQGASRAVTYQEWDKLWNLNKRVIDPVCPRHTALDAADKVPVVIENGPEEPEVVTVPKHKKYPPAGNKVTTRMKEIWLEQTDAQLIEEGEEVTLMDWGNCYLKDIRKDASGKVVSMRGKLHLEGNVKVTKWKLTWLPQLPDGELVDLLLVDFGYLLTKRKLEEDDNFEDFVNNHSRAEVGAIGDPNMRTLQKGAILQLERKGYYIVDVPLVRPGKEPMVLFTIPDGRTKAVTELGMKA